MENNNDFNLWSFFCSVSGLHALYIPHAGQAVFSNAYTGSHSKGTAVFGHRHLCSAPPRGVARAIVCAVEGNFHWAKIIQQSQAWHG